MSKDSPRTDYTEEVDLAAVSKNIGNFFRRINTFFYRCIRFVLRNIIIIGTLFILGAVGGYILDKRDAGTYKSQIIVAPNFGSTDYLYAKIEQLESKIKAKDSVYLLKIVGIKSPRDLREIKIVPVLDVFKFVSSGGTDHNYRMLELMAQDGDIKKVVTENMTAKNYPYHIISITTKGKTSEAKTIKPLMDYLNNSDHYKKIQKEYINNVHLKLAANDTMIAQIDGLLREFAAGSGGGQSVYISENTQLNDVIKTKDELVREQGIRRVELIGLDKIVKDNSIIPNIKEEGGTSGKMKLILPMLLIFIFLCIFAFRSFYRSQSRKFNSTK